MASKSFTVKGAKDHHTWTISLSESEVDSSNNLSKMSISLSMGSTSYTWAYWGSNLQYRLYVADNSNHNTIYYDTGWTDAPDHYPNSDSNLTWISNAAFNVSHDSSGDRTVYIYYEFKDKAGKSYTPGNASGSDTLALTHIARYLSIKSFSASGIYEESASFSWSTDVTCNSVQYRFTGTNWTTASSSAATSGTFTVSSLTVNTSYNIQIRCKRQDSGLWTEGSTISFKTYYYPYIESVPQGRRNIGDSYTLNLYNPLGRSCTITMNKDNYGGTQLFTQSNVTSSTFTFTPNTTTLYNSITNASSGRAVVYCTCSGNSDPTNNKNTGVYAYRSLIYEAVYSTCKPTWASGAAITYTDTNSTVRSVLGNSSTALVQNQSTPYLTIPTASGQYNATIDHYEVQLGNTKKSVNSSGRVDFLDPISVSGNVLATVKAIDTRGFATTELQKTISVLPWSKPTIILDTLQRRNNYGTTVDLKVTRTSYSSVNGKNASYLALSYSYTNGSGSTGSGNLTSGTGVVLSNINNNSVYTFSIRSQDAFSDVTTTYKLEKGVFLLMLDSDLLGVGINSFPVGSGLYGELGHLESTSSSGYWNEVRSKAAIFNNSNIANKFNALGSQKTDNGAWTIGSLTGNNNLYFSYSSDSNYQGGQSPNVNVQLDTNGRLTTMPTIYSGTSDSPSSSLGQDGDIYVYYETSGGGLG